jgi:hypothetical protein
MENRLGFFRQQMAAFEGSADPSKAITHGYYVPLGKMPVSDNIAGRLALRPTSSHLLLGGIGSGKTTEVLMAAEKIEKSIKKVYVRYVDVTLHTDLTKMKNGTLIAIVGLLLANSISNDDQEAVESSIKVIRKLAHGYHREYEVIDPSSEIRGLRELRQGLITPNFPSYLTPKTITKTDHFDGILSPIQRKDVSNDLNNSVQALRNHLRNQYECIFFLFDGLDRLDNSSAFYGLVENDLRQLSEMGIGSILVGNTHLLTSEQWPEDYSKSIIYQYNLDVEKDNDHKDFFMSVINSRTSQDFFEKDVANTLVHFSGGILRDLMTLTQTAIEAAYFSGENQVTLEHVETVIADFGRSRTFNLTNEELTTLRSFMAQEQTPVGEVANKLLLTGRLIEYQHPYRRCIVHPALQPLLTVAVAS